MVAPIIAAKAAKDVIDKKPSHAFDYTVKIIGLIFMFLIVVALFMIVISLIWGFPFFGVTSGYFPTTGTNNYNTHYTEKIITEYAANHTDSWSPFFPSGYPTDGCYLAYICPGVPEDDECHNDTNGCLEYAQTCTTNASCCSNCCKNMGSVTSPSYQCRFEEECGNDCYTTDQTCSTDNECCSGCCNKPEGSNYGMCASLDVCQQCKEAQATCTNSTQCCEGLDCVDGKCKEECGYYLDQCSKDSDCCSDCCRNNGECGFAQECCHQQNDECTSDSECCYGLTCQNDVCAPPQQDCNDLNDSCYGNSDCCSDCCLYIPGGPGYICQPEAACSCKGYGDGCKNNDECCTGFYCGGEYECTCVNYLAPCSDTMPCCSPYSCTNGYCAYPS